MHTCTLIHKRNIQQHLEASGWHNWSLDRIYPRITKPTKSLSDLHPQHQFLNTDCCNGMFDKFSSGPGMVNESPGNEDGNGTIVLHHSPRFKRHCPGTSGNQTISNLAMRNPPKFRFSWETSSINGWFSIAMFHSRRVNRLISVNSSIPHEGFYLGLGLPRQLRVLRSVSCGLGDQGDRGISHWGRWSCPWTRHGEVATFGLDHPGSCRWANMLSHVYKLLMDIKE